MSENNSGINTTPRFQNYLFVSLIIMLTATSVAAHQFKVPTIMGEIAGSLSMTESAVPWLMSIFTFVGIFLALPTGGLTQRFGPKNMVVAAAICVAIGSIIGTFATTGNMLIFSRGVEGIGFIFATVAGPAAIARYVEPSRLGSAMGIWAIWVPVGQILAFNFTPLMYGGMSWNNIWMVYAIVSLIMAGIAMFTVSAKMGNPVSEGGPEVKTSDVFSKKNLWLLCLSFCTFNIVFMAFVAFVPLYLETSGMMTKSAAAFATTIPMFICIVSLPVFGRVSDIIGSRKKLLLLAMLATGPAAALMFSTSTALVYVGAVLFGAIALGTPAMVLTSVGEVVENPGLFGVGMGLMMVFQNLGMFLGTFIFMPIVAIMGGSFTSAGMVLVPIALLGLLFAFLAKFK